MKKQNVCEAYRGAELQLPEASQVYSVQKSAPCGVQLWPAG